MGFLAAQMDPMSQTSSQADGVGFSVQVSPS